MDLFAIRISQPENGVQGIGKLDYVHNANHNFRVPRLRERRKPAVPLAAGQHSRRAIRRVSATPAAPLSATPGVMNTNTVVHTQFTGAHQLANIAHRFPAHDGRSWASI